MTAKSSRGTKRSKILSASQNNAKTALSSQQFADELQRDRLSRVQGEDLLLQEHRKVQLRIKALKEDLPHLHGQKFYKWQREFFESRNKINLLCAANQIGKALVLQERVATPDGWRVLKDIQVGDSVMDVQGRPTRVIDIPFVGVDDFYRITFNDDTYVDASANHLWICKGYEQRFRKKYKSRSGREWENPTYGQWVEKSTKEILEEGKYYPTTSGTKRFSIPVTSAVGYEEKDLFDPYYVGLLIGNGSLASVGASVLFHVEDTDLAEYANKYGNQRNLDRNVKTVGIRHEVYRKLVTLGLNKLSYLKEIPPEYLHGSIEQRKSLLAGLLDTDGCFDSGGNTTFSTTSKLLSVQVEELICSLGGLAQTRVKKSGYKKDGKFIQCNDCFETTVWTEFNPFRSRRKGSKWYLRDRYKQERVITKIEYLGKQVGKCITVDNVDGSFLCTNKYIVTHNSTCLIKKNIEWAGNVNLWPELWSTIPKMFWYFYPSNQVANVEFEKKWVPQYLPRGAMKSDKNYGWDAEYIRGDLEAVHFKSGISIYVKTYGQKLINLQTSTVHMISADEEMPPELIDELLARLRATGGYFNQVFTATMGYELWYRAMECIGHEDEAFKTAYKRVISLYDCGQYEDGTPSGWTPERMAEAEASCTSKKEVLKRIHGRFVRDEGLRYEAFDPDRNVRAPEPVPSNWKWYSAVDVGSGGKGRSAGAVVFLAVSPDFTRGRITRSWRGDYEETTAADILRKFRELRGSTPISQAGYDYASREFGIIAARSGEGFVRADKSRVSGEATLNTLFKAGALTIDSGVYHNQKLIAELMSVPGGAEKNRKYVDDLCFSGDTPIYTSRGIIPIRCVIPGDMVLNRFGWDRVLRTSCRLGETYVFALNRKRIACTENHKFFSNGDFQAIGDLETTQGMLFKGLWGYLCQLYQHQLYLREQRTVATLKVIKDICVSTTGPGVRIHRLVRALFTGIFGSITGDLSLKAMSFIIKMETHLITVLRILSVLVQASTCQITLQKGLLTRSIEGRIRSYWIELGRSQKHGMLLQKVEGGIKSMERLCGSTRSRLKNFVTIAAESLMPGLFQHSGLCSAPQIVGLHKDASLVSIMKSENAGYVGKIFPSISTLKQKTARSLAVQHVPGSKELVYNLAVERHQEYYASGFLVSNCDAAKYCCALVPWDFTKISPGASQFTEEQRDEIPQVQWTKEEYAAWEIRQRRGEFETSKKDDWSDFERECSEWNDLYGS